MDFVARFPILFILLVWFIVVVGFEVVRAKKYVCQVINRKFLDELNSKQ